MGNDGKVALQPPGWMGETLFAISVPHIYHRIKISFIQIEETGAAHLPLSAYKATKHEHL